MGDTAGGPGVAIVNETLAREQWPGTNPLGQRVRMLERGLTLEIVGVVADTRPFLPGAAPGPEIYWPNTQQPRWATFFVIRTADNPSALVEPVRRSLAEIDPDLYVGNVASLEQRLDRQVSAPRFQLLLLSLFAALALALAAVGLYAVIGYAVAQRTFEVGVRLALGATRRRIVGSIMGEGLGLIAAGLLAGSGLALALTRVISSLLHGVTPTDPATFAGVAALLGAVALLACAVPARRAASVDPTAALRHE
jgi:predicted lysophospholipase L1 biosynthesis ABC-type transport system permease subunit